MQNHTENITSENGFETAPVTGQEQLESGLDLQKLRKLRKGLRLTQGDAASLVGIHRTYFVLIETGKKAPSRRLQRAILEFMEKAEQQRPQTVCEQIRQSSPSNIPVDPPVRRVPVMTWASAAQPIPFEDLLNQVEERTQTECKDPNAFAIIIEGDSMEPKFFAGDCVVFARNSEPRSGDVVFARLKDGRVFFKYYYRCGPEGTRVKLVSENANYSPVEVDRSELDCLFPAWEVKRQLRQ